MSGPEVLFKTCIAMKFMDDDDDDDDDEHCSLYWDVSLISNFRSYLHKYIKLLFAYNRYNRFTRMLYALPSFDSVTVSKY